jgi:hypothetical protein
MNSIYSWFPILVLTLILVLAAFAWLVRGLLNNVHTALQDANRKTLQSLDELSDIVNIKAGGGSPATFEAEPAKRTGSEEDEMAVTSARSKLTMDFELGTQAPERITIEVLKQLVRQNPKSMAYAAQVPSMRLAALLMLLGEDTARLLFTELDPSVRQAIVHHLNCLTPVSLEEQTAILREFTSDALRANASLFANGEFAKAIQQPLPSIVSVPEPVVEKAGA